MLGVCGDWRDECGCVSVEEETGEEPGVVGEELGTVGVESEVAGEELRAVGVELAGPAVWSEGMKNQEAGLSKQGGDTEVYVGCFLSDKHYLSYPKLIDAF